VPVSPSIVRHEVSVRNRIRRITKTSAWTKQPATTDTRRELNEFNRVRIVFGCRPGRGARRPAAHSARSIPGGDELCQHHRSSRSYGRNKFGPPGPRADPRWTGASGPTADGGGRLIRTAFLSPDQGKRRIDRRWILTGAYDRGGRPGGDEIPWGVRIQRGHWRQDRPRGGSGSSEPIDLEAEVVTASRSTSGLWCHASRRRSRAPPAKRAAVA
jgi:hypothetical protein